MAAFNKRKTGAEKEEQAAEYLKAHGFQIVERNFRCRQGEIDIIGYDGEYLVFVEVKYRSSGRFDGPLAAVGSAKMQTICRVADYYRYQAGISRDVPVRYDVIGILQDEITWIPNAFPHIYRRS